MQAHDPVLSQETLLYDPDSFSFAYRMNGIKFFLPKDYF